MTERVVVPFERQQEQAMQSLQELKSGGGGGTSGGMDGRLGRLEARVDAIDQRLDGIDRRLERIEDKIPSKWDIAQVVFLVVGGLMAAAIFGPRLAALLPDGL